MIQSIVFITNYCPHLCPRCLSASGPNNSNNLTVSEVAHLHDSFVHLCGGEPLCHSEISLIVKDLFSRSNDVLLYTSLPYGFDPVLECLIKDYPRLKIRISVSDHLVEKSTAHLMRAEDFQRKLKRLGRDVVVTGYDRAIDMIPGGRRTDACCSARTDSSDPMGGMGPLFDVVYSDGSRDQTTLIRAHYREAEKSLHKTKLP